MHLLGMIVIGLIVGALAKLIMPGHDPGGIVVTILMGIAGSIVAELPSSMMSRTSEKESFGIMPSPSGCLTISGGYSRSFSPRACRRRISSAASLELILLV